MGVDSGAQEWDRRDQGNCDCQPGDQEQIRPWPGHLKPFTSQTPYQEMHW